MTSKNKEAVIKVIDYLESEVDRLNKLLEEEIPQPMKINDKKINLSEYIIWKSGSAYESVTLSCNTYWFKYKPYYGEWTLLKDVVELDKRKETILDQISKYEEDLKTRFEETEIVVNNNKIVQSKIRQLMAKVGIKEGYQIYDYETPRAKSKKWVSRTSGFVNDLAREAPTYNEYYNYASKVKDLRNSLDVEYNKAKIAIQKAQREEAAKKKASEDAHKIALLRAKYTPDNAYANASDILDAMFDRCKYLKLAHYLELNRGDWSDGYWYAERGLIGFTIDTPEDQEICDCIYKITQYEDVDGRYFRDCEYSYGVLFGKVDNTLLVDYTTVKELKEISDD